MEKHTNNTPSENAQEAQDGKTVEQDRVRESRRRFAMALSGSGVILSLASKPVMGSTYSCTGSGGMSGNTSSHGAKISCLACSPGYWKTSPGTWPSPYYPYSLCNCSGGAPVPVPGKSPSNFLTVFGAGPNQTMMWVLQNSPGSREFHATAALLNAAKAAAMGMPSAYTVSEITQMYRNGAPESTFSSTYAGNLHNCLAGANSNDNKYQAENSVFCNLIDSSGKDTGTAYNKC